MSAFGRWGQEDRCTYRLKFKVSLTYLRSYLKNTDKVTTKISSAESSRIPQTGNFSRGGKEEDAVICGEHWLQGVKALEGYSLPLRSPLLCSVEPWNKVSKLPLCQNHPECFLRTSGLRTSLQTCELEFLYQGGWVVTDFSHELASPQPFTFTKTVSEQRIQCLKQNRSIDF